MIGYIHYLKWNEWAENEKKSLEPVVNNETIPYSYVNYIYQEKNWKYPVCGADDGHCGHFYCMMCKELHLKDRA